MLITTEKIEKRIKGIYEGPFEDLPTEVQLRIITLFEKEKLHKTIGALIIFLGALLILLNITGVTSFHFSEKEGKNISFSTTFPGIIIAIIGLLYAGISINIFKSKVRKTKNQ